MRALDRKLLRDLWRLKWQVLAIALLVACGVSVAVMADSSQKALRTAKTSYYLDTRFADVFADARAAPLSVARQLAAIDGVTAVDARASRAGLMQVPGLDRPATGQLIALPDDPRRALNGITLVAGRLPDASRPGEVVALRAFLDAAHVRIGDRLQLTLEGRQIPLIVVGAALSPEFVYAPGGGSALPDEAHQGVFWGPREVVERATGLGGAFSAVSLRLAPGVQAERVIAAVDGILARYGGSGAYVRADQVSDRFQEDRIVRLGVMAAVVPPVFLAVAAGLVHMVLGRMVEVDREQIGLQKAFGYSNLQVALVYLKMSALIAVVGCVGGGLFGAWMGSLITGVLAQYMRFPQLDPQMSWSALAIASAVSVAATVSGSLLAVRRATRLSPAVALQPPTPLSFRQGLLERLPIWRLLDPPTRMIVRSLERFPVRAAMTAVGLALSLSLLIGSQFIFGSFDDIIDQAYFHDRHWTDTVTLADARDRRAVAELARLPGVIAAEPVLSAPARLRANGREERAGVTALDPNARLEALRTEAGSTVAPTGHGALISATLAQRLGVAAGDRIEVELTGSRPALTLVEVGGVVRQYAGLALYMDRAELSRLMGGADLATAAQLVLASDQRRAFYRALAAMPRAVGDVSRDDTIASFRENITGTLAAEMVVFVGFAGAIAFGVAYNVSRISLADRSRDLATLRVLGFEPLDCAYVLLGEIALLALVAVPFGMLGGQGLATALTTALAQQDLSLSSAIHPPTYASAFAAYLAIVGVACLLVGRQVWKLDLVAVLKTRE